MTNTLDLSALRAMRKSSASSMAKITSELTKQESGGFNKKEDERLWKAGLDKVGSGSAVIRFLPAIKEGDLPWVKMYNHGFKGPSGKWYIENCLTTIGQEDPVVSHVNELYNSGVESDKKLGGERKRRLSYACNVLVVKDPADPSNEGQVKIFKFGKKLFDKIKDKLQPAFEDEKAHDIFDPWEGANFRLRIRKVEGYSNSDKSEFDGASAISEDDEVMLRVLNQRHDIQGFLAPSNFKSYDELKKKLAAVLSTGGPAHAKASEFIMEDEPRATVTMTKTKSEAPKREKVAATDDDDLSFFENLISD